MKLYLVCSDIGQCISLTSNGIYGKSFLLSYLLFPNSPRSIQYVRQNQHLDFFLDSGAFAVFAGTGNVTLMKYIQFCIKYQKYFKTIASLDVIGDPIASMDNYKDMQRAGVDNVLPTWHAEEDISYLKAYAGKTDYIALGGLVGGRQMDRNLTIGRIGKAIDWLKHFDSKIKIHLFGVTSPKILLLFHKDVYSVDSSTWASWGHYGALLSINAPGRTFKYSGYRWKCAYKDIHRYNASRLLILEQMLNESKDKIA